MLGGCLSSNTYGIKVSDSILSYLVLVLYLSASEFSYLETGYNYYSRGLDFKWQQANSNLPNEKGMNLVKGVSEVAWSRETVYH